MSNPNYPDPFQQQPGDGTPGYPPAPGEGVTPPPPPAPGASSDAYGNPTGQPQSGYGTSDASTYGAPTSSGYGTTDHTSYGQNPAGGYTSPTGYQPEPEPKKSGGSALAAIIGFVLGAALGLVGGFFIWNGSGDDPKPSASATPTDTVEPTTEPTTGDPTDDPTSPETPEPVDPEPSDDPTDAPPLEGDAGTRNNPLPAGTEITAGDWKVTLDTPIDGTKAVAAENDYNDPAKDGYSYYLVPLKATYIGNESAHIWMDVRVEFVSDEGRTYNDFCSAQYPDDLMSIGELYEGGSGEGNTCVLIPKDAKGLWTVSTSYDEKIFFTAK